MLSNTIQKIRKNSPLKSTLQNTPIVSALRLKQENFMFNISYGKRIKPCLKIGKKNFNFFSLPWAVFFFLYRAHHILPYYRYFIRYLILFVSPTQISCKTHKDVMSICLLHIHCWNNLKQSQAESLFKLSPCVHHLFPGGASLPRHPVMSIIMIPTFAMWLNEWMK